MVLWCEQFYDDHKQSEKDDKDVAGADSDTDDDADSEDDADADLSVTLMVAELRSLVYPTQTVSKLLLKLVFLLM